MNMLTAPIRELGEYEEMQKAVRNGESMSVIGCVDSQKLHMVYGLGEAFPLKIIATYSDLRAKEICEDAALYDRNVMYYPAKDLIFYQADVHGNELVSQRVRCLRSILQGEAVTVVTTFDSLMTPQMPPEILYDSVVIIQEGGMVDTGALSGRLVSMGYEKTPQVEAPGQFSVRGGIIDVFDLTEENPYRIELWGEEVESVRSFDILSQRSLEGLKEIRIYPAAEMILTPERIAQGMERMKREADEVEARFRGGFQTEEAHRIRVMMRELTELLTESAAVDAAGFLNMESYIRYFYPEAVSVLELFDKKKLLLVLDEPARIKEHADAVELEFRESMMHRAEKGYLLPQQMNILTSVEEIFAKISGYGVVALSTMEFKNVPVKFLHKYSVTVRGVASYNNSFETLVKELEQYHKKGFRVMLFSTSRTRAKRLAEDLRERELNAWYTEDLQKELKRGEIASVSGTVRRGFEYPELQFVVLSENDIFTAHKTKKRYKKAYDGQKIRSFSDLKAGDYVVHENHGLGIYRGIEKIEMDKVTKDYMKIEYGGGGILYVLATGLDAIQKYASGDAAKTPKLNKLGTTEWERTKSRVRGAVTQVAQDLVELYAERQQKDGYVYGADTVWQREFEELFPYEETQDQLDAIEAVKKDMESHKIMDRLICGDVGYGKTEIAIRAAFKAVQENKQVVYLVPTTILAQQHYNTFVQRMKEFPVRVELLSRFRSAAQQKKTIEALRTGMADIVIGTHRVLSADVQFKDLGLLIVDEEQRFGVTHKEKIKKLKNTVDVMTLTATPIPRTMHMSLIGIRDMSVLEEAPNERLPIQTYVMEYNEEMVREAIVRELSRGGQVYYVYNRVHNIADITDMLKTLVPEANIAYAHGQMRETDLERIMFDFINGEIDVLVSTTIIETGMDISNVNTMIIHDSDTMGLAQLYQLRGRVGRSNRTAYAFLMYRRDKLLKEVAEKRLQAIREFTELGSGMKIAMRDLEIRGAGNLLGAEQHGHMEAVGYDLYCKMLGEAVKRLKGEGERADFQTTVDLDVDAYIPPSYIVNEIQKLDIYKRIAAIENEEQAEDMRDELRDRFGKVPKSAQNLMRISLIRTSAHRLYATELKGEAGRLRITMLPQAPVNVAKLPEFITSFDGALKFETKGVPAFIHTYPKIGIVEKDESRLMDVCEQVLSRMRALYED
ncbi:MAG: transcription-repair coupling factor [Lachnospiraceae bacterium]|nr:transcription-repair coupling factor [Lachnospiraceae bacterium]